MLFLHFKDHKRKAYSLHKTVKAFAPGAISSFFEIYDTKEDGSPLTNPEHVGAKGGGFGIQSGTHTTVAVQEAKQNIIDVYINSQRIAEAKTPHPGPWNKISGSWKLPSNSVTFFAVKTYALKFASPAYIVAVYELKNHAS